MIQAFARARCGHIAIEYVMIAALVSMAIVVGLQVTGQSTKSPFEIAAEAMEPQD